MQYHDLEDQYCQISKVMKSHRVGAELFFKGGRTAGQTYMTKLIVAYQNFANRP